MAEKIHSRHKYPRYAYPTVSWRAVSLTHICHSRLFTETRLLQFLPTGEDPVFAIGTNFLGAFSFVNLSTVWAAERNQSVDLMADLFYGPTLDYDGFDPNKEIKIVVRADTLGDYKERRIFFGPQTLENMFTPGRHFIIDGYPQDKAWRAIQNLIRPPSRFLPGK